MAVFIPTSRTVQRHVVSRLREAGALGVATAQPLADLSAAETRHVQRLLDAGVLHATHGGRYFVDEDAWSEYRRSRRVLGFTIVAVMAAVIVLVLVTTRGSR